MRAIVMKGGDPELTDALTNMYENTGATCGGRATDAPNALLWNSPVDGERWFCEGGGDARREGDGAELTWAGRVGRKGFGRARSCSIVPHSCDFERKRGVRPRPRTIHVRVRRWSVVTNRFRPDRSRMFAKL